VTRELAFLRARAELLRVRYEEPSRAEAREQALARLACDKKEVALLRAQRGHEQSFQKACRMFLKVRAALKAEGMRPGGTRGVDELGLMSQRVHFRRPDPQDLDAPSRIDTVD
jgi:hypothetical protein